MRLTSPRILLFRSLVSSGLWLAHLYGFSSGFEDLALLTLLGVATGVFRLLVGLGDTTNLSDNYPWGVWIGFDFTLIAFSGGAFTLCGLIVIFNQTRCRAVERPHRRRPSTPARPWGDRTDTRGVPVHGRGRPRRACGKPPGLRAPCL